ncbi:hypothetical protein EV192_113249 [Actinocrispum wychmicini]|uniref:Uncharacterized protein n=1 Tax=Actinocrispum wychmicini TaxID=1213861 RepID=A0A4R2J221_9PSEU|nr:hypothetical protein EV192_113249 [Actinocrispum wychmicini]
MHGYAYDHSVERIPPKGPTYDDSRAPPGRKPPPHPRAWLRARRSSPHRPRRLPPRRPRAPRTRNRRRSPLRRVRRVRVSALLGLVRGLLLRGLRMSDLQPRDLRLQRVRGHVRELHVRRLYLPNVRARGLTSANAPTDAPPAPRRGSTNPLRRGGWRLAGRQRAQPAARVGCPALGVTDAGRHRRWTSRTWVSRVGVTDVVWRGRWRRWGGLWPRLSRSRWCAVGRGRPWRRRRPRRRLPRRGRGRG